VLRAEGGTLVRAVGGELLEQRGGGGLQAGVEQAGGAGRRGPGVRRRLARVLVVGRAAAMQEPAGGGGMPAE
jgi:hypothetical protein